MKMKSILKLMGAAGLLVGVLFLKQRSNSSENDNDTDNDTDNDLSEQSLTDESFSRETETEKPISCVSPKEIYNSAKCDAVSSITERHQKAGEVLRESLNNIFNGSNENDCDVSSSESENDWVDSNCEESSVCDDDNLDIDNEEKFNKINNLLNEDKGELPK